MEFKQKRKRFNILKASAELQKVMPELPEEYVYKFITEGNFSSINFLIYLANVAHIFNFYASSFRIGKKELRAINKLYQAGAIDHCFFAVGTLMANDSEQLKKYKYYENFKTLCDENGWSYSVVNNHSKILLFDTDRGKFVLETSSNLNENPKIEQFSFEKDAALYDFYREAFESWGGYE